MVRRSLCGPIAYWILAQTSALVTWSLYEMRSTLGAPEVTGYGEPFGVTSSKMTANILQDDVMKYANVHFSITVCSEINSFQKPLLSRILRLAGGAPKTYFRVSMFYDNMKAYIKRSPSRIRNNFLAGMHRPEPRSFSCVMNLDEAGGVSMMSIGTAH